jgi:hypothetical protein
MNPAQMTNALKSDGFVAASFTANGVEKDSARRTNGWFLGMASITHENKSS